MALEDAAARFKVSLKDDTSEGANKASRALGLLQKQMKGGQVEIASIRKQMAALKAANMQGGESYKALEAKLKATGGALEKAQSDFSALGGVMGRNYAKSATKDTGGLLKAVQAMPGPLGRAASAGERVAASFGGMSVKTLAVAASSALLVAGVTAASVALTKYGIAVADARRNESLQLEGMTKIRNWYGLTADSAGFLQSTIDQVSASSAIGRDAVAGYAKQLYGMGLRAGNLQQALQGIATVASTQGDAQAQLFASMAAGAAAAGGSVKKLADDVKARLGGVAAKQMLSLDVQAMKLRENFAFLFSGLGIEKFLGALSKVYEMFSATSVTGKALKTMIDVMIQPLIDGSGVAMSALKRLFQGATIGALLLMVAFLKVRNAVRDAFEGTAVAKALKTFTGGLDGAKLAIGAGIALAGALATAMGYLAVTTLIAVGPWLLMGAAIAAVFAGAFFLTTWILNNAGAAWDWLTESIGKAVGFIKGIKWGEIGMDIIRGIVNGIKNGAAWVIEAMTGLAGSAVDAFKGALGIHSPSRVFMEQGKQIGAGASLGIEASAPDVQAAADAMAPAPNMQAQRGASSGGGITIGEIHLHTEAKDPKGFALAFRDELAAILEGAAIQMGGATA